MSPPFIVIPRIETEKLKIFTFGELKSATKNFRHDAWLGEGASGRVYKSWVNKKTYAPSKVGVGIPVAVKKFKPDKFLGLDQWQVEVKLLKKLSHPNIIKLLGYCWEDKEHLHVYEYMQNGSLHNHLFRDGLLEPLPWSIRLKIAIGAAQALVFLHSLDFPVIYRNFKTSHILLDGAYNAKLSGFGLAKFGPSDGNSHVTVTTIVSTFGYGAPEYFRYGHLSVKHDVYCFGMVLLQMLTGRRTADVVVQNLEKWARASLSEKRNIKIIMDPRLQNQYPPTAAYQAAQLSLKCLEFDPKTRPSMIRVLENLEQINAID